jgi:hypothetical protein
MIARDGRATPAPPLPLTAEMEAPGALAAALPGPPGPPPPPAA